jgi:hypothetical protein
MTVRRTALTTLVTCGLAASAGIASAQDAAPGDDPARPAPAAATPAPATAAPASPDGRIAASPEGTAAAPPEDAAAAPPDGVTAAAEPAARWPRAVIARPLTLPAGVAQLGADFSASGDATTLANVLGYGVTDDLEATALYAISLQELELGGSFDLDLGYKLARGALGGKLEVIARGRAGYNAGDSAANPLRLGVQVQYNVTDRIAVITPGQQLVLALADDDMGNRPVFLQLPAAIGVQATPELYLQLDTTLAAINIAKSSNAWFGADSTPLALTLVYNAVPAVDLIGSIALNLTPPRSTDPMVADPGVGDTLAFLLGGRFYLGKL